MPTKTIHNARTGEITEIEVSELEMEREKLGMPAEATEAEIQAERQRRQAQAEADLQQREQMAELAPDKLLQRIEALEAEIAQLRGRNG